MSLETWAVRLQPHADTQTAPACVNCAVRSKAMFAPLSRTHLEQAGPSVTHLALPPGEAVYRFGAPGAAVFTLRSGIVRFERVTASGSRRIVRMASTGALLGQEALLHASYGDDVIACTPVEVCRIPRASVERLAQDSAVLVRELMQRWQAAVSASHHWTAELAWGSARRRMLKLLEVLLHLSPDGERVWLPSRLEMSDMLDLAEETTSRQVARLRAEGVVRSDRPGSATIHATRLHQALRKLDR